MNTARARLFFTGMFCALILPSLGHAASGKYAGFVDGALLEAREEAAHIDAITGAVRIVSASLESATLELDGGAVALSPDMALRKSASGASIITLGSGQFYADAEGALQPTKIEPVIRADGSASFEKQSARVVLKAEANQETVVEIRRDGEEPAQSALAGLAYHDPGNGRMVLIADVRDSSAVVMDDGAYYTNAFTGVDADVLYKVQPWGLEQDVVVFGGLPDPALLKMDLDGTHFCILTELVGLDPVKLGASRSGGSEPGIADTAGLEVFRQDGLDWKRVYNWLPCHAWGEDDALVVGGEGPAGARQQVAMRLIREQGRVFLSEEVPLKAMLAAAPQLVKAESEASQFDLGRTLPARRPVPEGLASTPAASQPRMSRYTPRANPRYVIDYVLYTGSNTANVVFEAGQTYFVSNTYYVAGSTLTIKPGAVVKFATNGQIKVENGGQVVTRSHAYAPAILTSAFDTNVGESISGYAGNPATNRYPAGLVLGGKPADLEGLKIQYAKVGIQVAALATNTAQSIRHTQLLNCNRAVEVNKGSGGVMLFNCLVRDSTQGVYAVTNSLTLRFCTFDTVPGWAIHTTGAVSSLALEHSFFSGVVSDLFASNGNVSVAYLRNGTYNFTSEYIGADAISLGSAAFRVGPQGSNYLDQACGLIDAGPTVASSNGLYFFTTASNQALEANSSVDAGFHYPNPANSDGDALYDFQEDLDGDGVYEPGSDLSDWTVADTDGDGLDDYAEYTDYGTDPEEADTDGDGQTDYVEVHNGSNPLNPYSMSKSLSGNISYAGSLTGTIHVTVAAYALTTNRPAMQHGFDENQGGFSYDNSAYDNLAASRGATWTTNGQSGGAFFFDGNDTLSLGDLTIVEGLYGMSWGAWVFATNGMSLGGVMGKTLANDESFFLLCNSSGTGGHAQVVPQDRAEERNASANNIVTNGVWEYLSAVYDGTNIAMYVNGNMVGSNTFLSSKTVRSNAVNATIGDVAANRGWYFKGRLDDVRIYRTALASNELRGLYFEAAGQGLRRTTNYSAPGAYAITNLFTLSNYWVSAWMDANGNGRKDFHEPQGYWSGNGALFTNSVTDADIVLVEPDTDGDGTSDYRELQAGTDPIRSAVHPELLGGSITYTGRQAGPIVVQAVAEPGLLLHYGFDGNQTNKVNDLSGNGWTGVVYGATYTTNGYNGSAYSFDGTNDYILAGNLGVVATGTVSFWMNADAVENNRNPFTSDFASGSDNLRLEEAAGGSFYFFGDGVTNNQPFMSNMQSSTWYHVVLAWSRTNVTGFLNGTQKFQKVHAGVYPPGLNLNLSSVAIGNGYASNATRFWRGRIDEVKIYRKALTAAEVSNLYATGASTTGTWTTTLSAPGTYTISNVPNSRLYALSAFMDSNSNSIMDIAEARGVCASNPVHLLTATTNLPIALTDPDSDSDGIPDWWEILYGLNPTSGVSTSLRLWYKLDEGSGIYASNSASTLHTGTLANMATSAWSAAKVGTYALAFDGTNDFVTAGAHTNLQPADALTLSAWFKLNSNSVAYAQIVSQFRWLAGNLTTGYGIYRANNREKISFAAGFLGEADGGITDIPITYDTWYHAAMTYSKTAGYLRAYIDGIQVGAIVRTNNIRYDVTSPLLVGQAPCLCQPIMGSVDDVRLYASALSSNEIATLYDALQDTDGDGLSNSQEYESGTHPLLADTDGDGFSDGEEVIAGGDPLNAADGVASLDEARQAISYHWSMIYTTPLVFTNTPGSAADLQDLHGALQNLSGKFQKMQ